MSLVVIYEGQRKVVKVPSPNTLVQHILSDVSQQFKVDPAKFALQHKRTILDNAQPFRFCGLSNNAQVDLVARALASQAQGSKPCKIAFAVNGTDSNITETFDGGLTLLEVLSQLVNAGKLPPDTLERSPELVYLRAKYDGSALLAGTTLSSLGLSGQSARFQLRYGSAGTSSGAPPSLPSPTPLPPAPALAAPPSRIDAAGGSGSEPTTPVSAPIAPAADADHHARVAETTAILPVARSHMDVTPPETHPAPPPMQDPSAAPSTPAMSAADAVAFLLTGNFDAVSGAAVLTLAKYLLNLLLFPGEEKYRRINTENKAFVAKVAAAKGSAEFLLSVGFLPVTEAGALLLPVEAGPRAAAAQARRVDEGWAALRAAMDELDIPQGDRPAEASMDAASLRRQSAEREAAQLREQQAVAFDPFRSHIVRAAPQPAREKRALQENDGFSMDVSEEGQASSSSGSAKGSAVAISATEAQLLELQRKRLEMEGSPADVLRCSEVIFPPSDSAKSSAATGSGAGEPMDVEDGPSGKGGGVPRSVLQKILRSGGEEDSAPLTTQAVRDLQRAQRERVYSRTLIKIRFPDRVCLQGYFHPRHTVGDIYEWVAQSLASLDSGFELYTSPPRCVLSPGVPPTSAGKGSAAKAVPCGTVERQGGAKEAPTLADLMLVPAALIYLAWKDADSAPALRDSAAPGSYLATELLASSSAEGKGDAVRAGTGPSAAYPAGRALAPPPAHSHAEGAAAHGKAGGTARDSHKSTEDAGAAPKSSKPKWFKV